MYGEKNTKRGSDGAEIDQKFLPGVHGLGQRGGKKVQKFRLPTSRVSFRKNTQRKIIP
jgi:hypothetical protein